MNGCVYHLDYPELRELFSSPWKRISFANANKLLENQEDCTVYCDPVVAMEEEQVLAGEMRTLSLQYISQVQERIRCGEG